MERQALYELCRQVAHALAHEQGWTLVPSGLHDWIEAVFSFAQTAPDPTPQTIRIIALNYNLDGPRVQQMLMPDSVLGNALWTEWRTHVLKIAATKKLALQDDEDLVQAVYLETLKALPTFRFQARLNTYFVAIFNRQYSKWLQQQMKVRQTDLTEESPAEPALVANASTEQVERDEIYRLVKQEITKILNSTDYQILHWYYVEESYDDPVTREQKKWTDKAIGEKLEMPLDTITARRRRALQRLRQSPRLAQWAALFNLSTADD